MEQPAQLVVFLYFTTYFHAAQQMISREKARRPNGRRALLLS